MGKRSRSAQQTAGIKMLNRELDVEASALYTSTRAKALERLNETAVTAA